LIRDNYNTKLSLHTSKLSKFYWVFNHACLIDWNVFTRYFLKFESKLINKTQQVIKQENLIWISIYLCWSTRCSFSPTTIILLRKRIGGCPHCMYGGLGLTHRNCFVNVQRREQHVWEMDKKSEGNYKDKNGALDKVNMELRGQPWRTNTRTRCNILVCMVWGL